MLFCATYFKAQHFPPALKRAATQLHVLPLYKSSKETIRKFTFHYYNSTELLGTLHPIYTLKISYMPTSSPKILIHIIHLKVSPEK